MSKRGKNCFPFPSIFFHFYCIPAPRFQSREYSYVSWHLAYKNQVCIAQIVRKNVIGIWNIFNMVAEWWCLASLYREFSRFYRTLKVNNLISVNFQTQVSILFLFSTKFCTRIINKKGEYERVEIEDLDPKLKTWTDLVSKFQCAKFLWNLELRTNRTR